MIDPEQSQRFQRMQTGAPRLRDAFSALTGAHRVFQGCGLRSISVSDELDGGAIEATFQGVRIKLQMLIVFGDDWQARARVVCMHCHCTYGKPVQTLLGSFHYNTDGETDLEPHREGQPLRMGADSAAIILHFLQAAIMANKLL